MEDGDCLEMGLFEEENSDLETEVEAAEEEPESCLLSISDVFLYCVYSIRDHLKVALIYTTRFPVYSLMLEIYPLTN